MQKEARKRNWNCYLCNTSRRKLHISRYEFESIYIDQHRSGGESFKLKRSGDTNILGGLDDTMLMDFLEVILFPCWATLEHVQFISSARQNPRIIGR